MATMTKKKLISTIS
ncbi:bacterial DNA-binding family protein, partial [Chlamydia psittaci 08-2626_L3]